MNLTTEHANGIAVVRVGESRLMYPLLSEFSTAVTQLIAAGERKVIIDLSTVGYVDSATIGCLMDLYRQATAAGGSLKLAGVQKRVETMLTMTGAHNFIQLFADEATALATVRVNGREFGTLWIAPWRVDITAAVKSGPNSLEIETVNPWNNRLVGDRDLPTE